MIIIGIFTKKFSEVKKMTNIQEEPKPEPDQPAPEPEPKPEPEPDKPDEGGGEEPKTE